MERLLGGEKQLQWPQRILVAHPHGFCTGVVRAVDALEEAQKRVSDGERVYSYHQIIHNKYVVGYFEQQGIKFVNELSEVPEGSVLVFSAITR